MPPKVSDAIADKLVNPSKKDRMRTVLAPLYGIALLCVLVYVSYLLSRDRDYVKTGVGQYQYIKRASKMRSKMAKAELIPTGKNTGINARVAPKPTGERRYIINTTPARKKVKNESPLSFFTSHYTKNNLDAAVKMELLGGVSYDSVLALGWKLPRVIEKQHGLKKRKAEHELMLRRIESEKLRKLQRVVRLPSARGEAGRKIGMVILHW
jgi:hypothetical protein